ncbi:MAG TPA: hypothetical protein VMS74_06200 [Acidimicrobiia bacterium]|nr:hypothetical protein [Acidimicrobiia bacterium]
MEHHADFAVAVTQRMEVTTIADPDDGIGPIAGRVITLGWWVEAGAAPVTDLEPAGVLYLVADERRPRPMWVKQADLTSVRIHH